MFAGFYFVVKTLKYASIRTKNVRNSVRIPKQKSYAPNWT